MNCRTVRNSRRRIHDHLERSLLPVDLRRLVELRRHLNRTVATMNPRHVFALFHLPAQATEENQNIPQFFKDHSLATLKRITITIRSQGKVHEVYRRELQLLHLDSPTVIALVLHPIAPHHSITNSLVQLSLKKVTDAKTGIPIVGDISIPHHPTTMKDDILTFHHVVHHRHPPQQHGIHPVAKRTITLTNP